MKYATWRAQYYGWLDSSNNLLSGLDFTIDDIIQEVIIRAISGDREWDPSRGNLLNWLKFQINSVMDAWIKSARGKFEVPFAADNEDPDTKESTDSISLEEAADGKIHGSEKALIDRETTQDEQHFLSLVFDAISDDPELVTLFDAIVDLGDNRPRILAEALNTSTTDINNRKRRWARRISELNSIRKGLNNE